MLTYILEIEKYFLFSEGRTRGDQHEEKNLFSTRINRSIIFSIFCMRSPRQWNHGKCSHYECNTAKSGVNPISVNERYHRRNANSDGTCLQQWHSCSNLIFIDGCRYQRRHHDNGQHAFCNLNACPAYCHRWPTACSDIDLQQHSCGPGLYICTVSVIKDQSVTIQAPTADDERLEFEVHHAAQRC